MRFKQRFTVPVKWLMAFGLAMSIFRAQAQAPAQTQTNLPPAPRRPSIILIVADDLGYGDLGCYGQTRVRTPHLDELAAQGMRFTSFYAGSPADAPSRAALMLGKNTGHLRIRGESRPPLSLQSDDLTMAELLKGAGYQTGAIGKWALGEEGSSGVPSRKGFVEWFGYLNATHAEDRYTTFLYRTGPERPEHDRKRILEENLNGARVTYADDFFTSAAMRFITNSMPDQFNGYRPFFLYLAYTLPHANNDLARRTGNGMEVPGDQPYSGEPWPAPERNKAAMITRLDGYVGRLMEELKLLRLESNTLLIFTSGNGPHSEGGVDAKFFNSAGPWRGGKRDLHEGGIRVPLIVRWPLLVPAGTTNDLPLASWDLLPTAADIARVKPPKDLDGISFLTAMQGLTQTNRHEFLYWEFHEGGFQQAARMGDWKALRNGVDGPLELYDLKLDHGERTNVAAQHVDLAGKITEYLKTARTNDPRWPAKTVAENALKPAGDQK